MSTTTFENNVNVWGSDGSFDMKQFRCNERKSYSKDKSYTVWYKAGQINEHEFHSHLSKIKALHGPFSNKVFWHPDFFSGYVLPGDVPNKILDIVRSFPGIHSVGRTKVYKNSVTTSLERNLAKTELPWGLDRISHKKLPLHHNYTAFYSGAGTNVFIVDTGIDTGHSQFKAGKLKRTVENIYDGSDPGQIALPLNIDNEGHGTHVAGTVGGNDVGVSPGANIYGVKVLGDPDRNLKGNDIDILMGLAFVKMWYLTNDHSPSVVSMSLGRNCETLESCQDDILVKAVEDLSKTGIVVVVAAGNDECDSCFSSPAFAQSAITVGASSITDDAAVFSDFGKCIDVYAPGVGIKSACGQRMCGTLDQTISLDGTSMACPHVSGVMAQLLQAYPASTVSEITNKLICDTSKMVLDIKQDRPPAITRNLLLQVPQEAPPSLKEKPDFKPVSCDLGAGCKDKCSGNGFCQEGRCLCDGLAWGSNCSTVDVKEHCDLVR